MLSRIRRLFQEHQTKRCSNCSNELPQRADSHFCSTECHDAWYELFTRKSA